MKTIQFNGEYWYEEDRSVVGRIARWVLWPGGWETFRSWPLRERIKPDKWTPLSLLGHRITFYGWGVQAWRWTLTFGEEKQLYRSVNGTPWAADKWLMGAPPQVRHAAKQKASTTDEHFEPVVIR